MRHIHSICVFCASSNAVDAVYLDAATDLNGDGDATDTVARYARIRPANGGTGKRPGPRLEVDGRVE